MANHPNRNRKTPFALQNLTEEGWQTVLVGDPCLSTEKKAQKFCEGCRAAFATWQWRIVSA
jgi:hypothetical protein